MYKHFRSILHIVCGILLIAVGANAQFPGGTGYLMDDVTYQSIPIDATMTRNLYASLPSSVLLRKYCPTPGDQGNYGTCAAWSAAYAARTILWAKRNGLSGSAINAHTFSPGFSYRLVKKSGDNICAQGVDPYEFKELLRLMKEVGAVTQPDMQDGCPGSISQALMSRATTYRINDFARLYNEYDNASVKIETVKLALANNSPVVIGMSLPPSFGKAKDVWEPAYPNEMPVTGHAMCVVGYDNNMAGGAFQIMNSWGTTKWGNGGFTWIPYKYFAQYVP